MDSETGCTEFAQLLAAAAARRHQALARTDHRRLDDFPAAAHDHSGNGAGFGAGSFRIGGILDIAACMHGAMLVLYRGSDEETRIRRVGFCPRPDSRGDEGLVGHYFSFT